MEGEVITTITGLTRKWKLRHFLAALLWSVGTGLICLGILLWTIPHAGILPLASISVFVSLAAMAIYLNVHDWLRYTNKTTLHYIHKEFPNLEYSLDLVWKANEGLNPVLKWQKVRTIQVFESIRSLIKTEQPLPLSLIPVSLGAIILLFALTFPQLPKTSSIAASPLIEEMFETESQSTIDHSFEIQALEILVEPPAYTAIPAFRADSLSFEVPAGSIVHWTIKTNNVISGSKLWINDQIETEGVISADHLVQHKYRVDERVIYRIELSGENRQFQSNYAKIDVTPDLPPIVKIDNLETYTIYPDAEVDLRLKAVCSDDYGIHRAQIVTTISRGEGESVVFKNDTLPYIMKRSGLKEYTFQSEFYLDSMGLTPGDELYLHLEATDNKQPRNQVSRTAKYIIAIADTGKVLTGIDGRLGVNRMPEYFRSQRQIIIDTERLIANKSELTPSDFMNKSNNIAIDQKLLRLRYGQFLGEEYETTIGLDVDDVIAGAASGQNHHNHEEEHSEGRNPALSQSEETYLQQDHDHDNISEEGFGVSQEEVSQEELEAMLEPYAHFHDRSEQAGYFDLMTVAKLKAALAEMWSSEFHLRMGEPSKALPFEYRALRLIKEIQQASRIYVERIGFEPPEINVAADRLKGDLDDLGPIAQKYSLIPSELKDNLIQSIQICATYLESEDLSLSVSERQVLELSGKYMSAVALESAGYLLKLQLLRDWLSGEYPDESRREMISQIQEGFHRMLNAELLLRSGSGISDADITRRYITKLRQDLWQ